MQASRAAKESVLVYKSRPALAVTGRDRVSWLNGLVTCDLTSARGGASYGLFVGKTGKILSDAWIFDWEDSLVAEVSEREALVEFLDKHLVMEDAEVVASPTQFWFVVGPKAGELCERLGVKAVPFARPSLSGLVAGVGADVPVEAEATALGGGILDEGTSFFHAHGIARFGIDFDQTFYPHEASLERVAVSFTKGCYLGQEVICMTEMRGHAKRRLVPFRSASGVPGRGAAVHATGGERVGEVTSASLSEDGQGGQGFCVVHHKHCEPGTLLVVADGASLTVLAPL